MKRVVFVCELAIFLFGMFVSCASLQEDIYTTADGNDFVYQSVEEYENRFLDVDAMIANGQVVSVTEIDALISDIDKQLDGAHVEPAVVARLNAFKGLLYLNENKKRKAEECFATAKSLQASDDYVQLLNIRLQKDNDDAIRACDEILSYSPDNPTILLEKGLRLFKNNRYSESVATIDNAFMIFDRKGKTYYRDSYSSIRDSIWELKESGLESITGIDVADFTKPLTKEKMVELTVSNTSLLDGFTGGEKIATSSLVKKLEAAGYFSVGSDQSNKNNSSADIMSSSEITRSMCARFLWNLYAHETGNTRLLTAYSTRYARLKNPESPIDDVPLDSQDFDAVLGVVEKEIMNLPDGKNFNSEKIVTVLEFTGFVQACAARCK